MEQKIAWNAFFSTLKWKSNCQFGFGAIINYESNESKNRTSANNSFTFGELKDKNFACLVSVPYLFFFSNAVYEE